MYKVKQQRYHDPSPTLNKNPFARDLGTEHPLPHGMTRNDYEKLRRMWDLKLKESGFVDVEKVNPRTGLVDLNFRSSGTTSRKTLHQQSRDFRTDKAEYFRLCRGFLAHADFVQLFGKNAKLYTTMFAMHAEGASFRRIAKHFRGTNVSVSQRRPKASEFWSHNHIHGILKVMWTWHRTHPEGLLLAGESDD